MNRWVLFVPKIIENNNMGSKSTRGTNTKIKMTNMSEWRKTQTKNRVS